jgi:N-acetyltransferase
MTTGSTAPSPTVKSGVEAPRHAPTKDGRRVIGPDMLAGALVRLVPLAMDHHDDLVKAVEDGEIWRLWYTRAPAPGEVASEIGRRLARQASGEMAPYAVLDADGRAVGITSYLHIDADSPRVEIGATWYARRVQRTGLNTEAKLLMLAHAFDTLGCIAVEMRTHFMNHQSRAAIERLGAKLDGTLRSHQRSPDGMLRDTCVYSIVASEWPAVRQHLTWQLTKPR